MWILFNLLLLRQREQDRVKRNSPDLLWSCLNPSSWSRWRQIWQQSLSFLSKTSLDCLFAHHLLQPGVHKGEAGERRLVHGVDEVLVSVRQSRFLAQELSIKVAAVTSRFLMTGVQRRIKHVYFWYHQIESEYRKKRKANLSKCGNIFWLTCYHVHICLHCCGKP